MNHFTDSLLKDFLLEASYSEQEEKMDLWHNGQRKQNIRACSDDKLKVNFDICVRKGYDHEALLLRNEAEIRDLWWKNAPTSRQLKPTPAPSSSQVQPGAEPLITIAAPKVEDFTLELAKKIKLAAGDRIMLRGADISSQPQNTLTALIIALVLKDQAAVAVLEEKLLEWNVDKDDAMEYMRKCLDEPIKSKLKELVIALTEGVRNTVVEALEKHETLNTKLWTNKAILKDEVKEKVEAIVTEFIDGLEQDGVKIVVKDIILIGSNCSYNYTDMSDLDIHIVADTSELQCQENVYPALYGAYRSLFSRKFDIDFYGIPVELYVETEETKTISNGVYSVLNNTWIKEPIKEAIPNIDTKAFEVDFQKWELAYNKVMKKSEDLLDEPKKILEKELEQKIKDIETTDLDHVLNTLETEVKEKAEDVGIQKEEPKEEPIQTTMPETTMQLQIEQFINDLYTLRKYGLATDGEYSVGNLVFKEMRNKGYLDALKALKNKLVAQSLSLKDVEKPIKDSLGEGALENDPLRDCKIKIERIVHNQAIVQPNGRFQVYLVKETDVQDYINKLKRLENVEKVSALPSGKYDFSHVGVNKIPHRYFTISGMIVLP